MKKYNLINFWWILKAKEKNVKVYSNTHKKSVNFNFFSQFFLFIWEKISLSINYLLLLFEICLIIYILKKKTIFLTHKKKLLLIFVQAHVLTNRRRRGKKRWNYLFKYFSSRSNILVIKLLNLKTNIDSINKTRKLSGVYWFLGFFVAVVSFGYFVIFIGLSKWLVKWKKGLLLSVVVIIFMPINLLKLGFQIVFDLSLLVKLFVRR